MSSIQDLHFILNLLAQNTDKVSLYRERLSEFCSEDQEYRMRINNILELLKVDTE